MKFGIKENLPVIIEKYLYHESLNKKILEDSKQFEWTREQINFDGGASNVRSLQTIGPIPVGPTGTPSKNVGVIINWVFDIAKNYSLCGTLQVSNIPYKLESAWMANYGKGDHTISHVHIGDFAFIYFVKTPPGSSPLVYTTSGKRIKAEEGKLILFSTRIKHHVPKNRCDNRIVLSGNLVQSTNDK